MAVIGILLLMLLKLRIYMKDMKEWKKFENEKKKSKWAEVRRLIWMSLLSQLAKKKITTNILKFFCFYSVYSVFVSLLFVKHLLSCLNDNLPH